MSKTKSVILPDGSACMVVSAPLPGSHWLYADRENVPPMPLQMGTSDPRRAEMVNRMREVAKYAIRCATMNGRAIDFDPDAMVQNFVVGMLGCFTEDGTPNT